MSSLGPSEHAARAKCTGCRNPPGRAPALTSRAPAAAPPTAQPLAGGAAQLVVLLSEPTHSAAVHGAGTPGSCLRKGVRRGMHPQESCRKITLANVGVKLFNAGMAHSSLRLGLPRHCACVCSHRCPAPPGSSSPRSPPCMCAGSTLARRNWMSFICHMAAHTCVVPRNCDAVGH